MQTTRSTVELPPELESALASAPQARAIFDRLPPSHRKQYADWISEAKRPETRAKRVQQTMERMTPEHRGDWRS